MVLGTKPNKVKQEAPPIPIKDWSLKRFATPRSSEMNTEMSVSNAADSEIEPIIQDDS